MKEAKRVGTRQHRRLDRRRDNYNRIPAQDELTLTPDAAYVHITSNNTIYGTQWHTLPDVGDAPLVATPRPISSAGRSTSADSA